MMRSVQSAVSDSAGHEKNIAFSDKSEKREKCRNNPSSAISKTVPPKDVPSFPDFNKKQLHTVIVVIPVETGIQCI